MNFGSRAFWLPKCFRFFFGLTKFGKTVFAKRYFVRNGEAILKRDAVGICRCRKDLGAIDRDGEIADFEDLCSGGEFEDLLNARGEKSFVFAPELTDRIVIGRGLVGEEVHREIFVSEGLDPAVREGAGGVAIDQESYPRGRRILCGTGATFIDFGRAQIECLNGIHDKVDHVIFGDLFP